MTIEETRNEMGISWEFPQESFDPLYGNELLENLRNWSDEKIKEYLEKKCTKKIKNIKIFDKENLAGVVYIDQEWKWLPVCKWEILKDTSEILTSINKTKEKKEVKEIKDSWGLKISNWNFVWNILLEDDRIWEFSIKLN